MSYRIFESDGRLRIPRPEEWPKVKEEVRREVTVDHVFCPLGHDLVDPHRLVGGLPGIRLEFRRPNGELGEVVLSPTLGCFDKLVLSSALVEGERLELFCPVCHSPLPVLMECHCRPDALLNMLYLTRDSDPYEAIAFCCIVGCHNSALIRSGAVLRAASLGEW